MANNTIAVLRQMLASLDDAKKYQSLRVVLSFLFLFVFVVVFVF